MLRKFLSIVLLLLLLNRLSYAQSSSKESSQTASSQQSEEPVSKTKPIRSPSSRPTVKLSPYARSIEQSQQTPIIPVEAIQQFLIRPKVVTEDELEMAGYVVANAEGAVFSSIGHKVYVRNLERQPHENHFIIVALGQAYRDPNNDNEVLAYEATYLGEGTLEPQEKPDDSDEDQSDIVTLRITSSIREIEVGARVLSLEGRVINEDFHPHTPDKIEDAYIIGVMDNVAQISQYHVVVINRGSQEGIERGHLLAVNKSAPTVKDKTTGEWVKLPSRRAGMLLIFKVFERVSYALVMESVLPIDLFDKVVIP